MSPAEITQQLGLQSLTRRAWVSSSPRDSIYGTSLTRPVHPIHLRHHRRRPLRGSGVARRRSPEDEPRLSGYNHETRVVYVGAREKYRGKSANDGLMMTMAGVLREASTVSVLCVFSPRLLFLFAVSLHLLFLWRHVKIAVSPFQYHCKPATGGE